MIQSQAEATAPRHLQPGAPGPVVLGTEFGSVSAAAERVAIRLARGSGAPLLIVHGLDSGRLWLAGGRFGQRVDQVRSARETDALALMSRVRAAGVEPQLLIWDGDPATCILEAAAAEGATRIVVGSHGRGWLGRVIVGSVSSIVAARAACPVDIVQGDGAKEEIVTIEPAAESA